MLRRTLEPKEEEVITRRRKLRNVEPNDLFAYWADVREVSEGEMGEIRSMQWEVSHYVI